MEGAQDLQGMRQDKHSKMLNFMWIWTDLPQRFARTPGRSFVGGMFPVPKRMRCITAEPEQQHIQAMTPNRRRDPSILHPWMSHCHRCSPPSWFHATRLAQVFVLSLQTSFTLTSDRIKMRKITAEYSCFIRNPWRTHVISQGAP